MKNGLLVTLPPPPEGKTGWPWTVESTVLQYNTNTVYPKISIITPSFNQGGFIEETIRSVLLQNFPNLEFIVIDGGSTDNTVEIIKKYENWITFWVSEKDRGQSHAINKAIKHITGKWVGWQNSDDIYCKNAFYEFIRIESKNKNRYHVYFGNAYLIDSKSNVLYKKFFHPFHKSDFLYSNWNLTNQSSFYDSSIIKSIEINERLKYAMDGDLIFKLISKDSKFKFINKFLGCFRLQENSKTTDSNLSVKIGNTEWIDLRAKHGIKMTNSPWKNQFFIRKKISLLRKIFYLLYYNNLLTQIKQYLNK